MPIFIFTVTGLDCQATGPKRFPLPDTGQTAHYTQTFGEDSDYVADSPSLVDNGDGTVTDTVTGLIWQQVDGGEMTWEQSREYASELSLAGKKDWRLPNSLELFSILNHGAKRPALDTKYFPNSEAEYWWTNSPRADGDSRVWVVNAGGGIGAHPRRETISAGGQKRFHVRCVREASPFGTGPELLDNKNGAVADQATGLVWQKTGPAEAMSWEEALTYCDNLDLTGEKDWRLPNIKELRSLSDDRKMGPSIDKEVFPDAQAKFYWSSTSLGNHPVRAWYVDFQTGLVTYADKPEKLFVRAVRGGGAVPLSKIKEPPDPKLFTDNRGNRGDRPDRKNRNDRQSQRP
ncbi:MAG: DUF1566 domain-containing protein [Verrucomicrobiae bacterium]|nr:DUF1566 domain-containing protein [Verrucomicrobiae bacterium]